MKIILSLLLFVLTTTVFAQQGCAKAKKMAVEAKASLWRADTIQDIEEIKSLLRKSANSLIILPNYAADDECGCEKVRYNNDLAYDLCKLLEQNDTLEVIKKKLPIALEKVNGIEAILNRCDFENR